MGGVSIVTRGPRVTTRQDPQARAPKRGERVKRKTTARTCSCVMTGSPKKLAVEFIDLSTNVNCASETGGGGAGGREGRGRGQARARRETVGDESRETRRPLSATRRLLDTSFMEKMVPRRLPAGPRRAAGQREGRGCFRRPPVNRARATAGHTRGAFSLNFFCAARSRLFSRPSLPSRSALVRVSPRSRRRSGALSEPANLASRELSSPGKA